MEGKINYFKGEYAFLSNLFEAPVSYDGITYKNNEAAFQAQKCANRDDRYRFASLSALDAKQLGRQVTLRKDWESIKIQVMADIVHNKFLQNRDLMLKLLATDNAYLEEGNTWGDRVWGTVNGVGANLLGRILMDERAILKKLMDK